MVAPDMETVSARLLGDGHVPLRIEQIAAAGSARWLNADIFPRKLDRRQLGEAFRDIALLLHAGVAPDRALDILARIARASMLRELLGDIRDRVKGGAALSDALEASRHSVPAFAVATIRAGEVGGSLETVLQRLSEYFERAHALRSQVLGALIYPCILLVMAGLSLALLVTLVIPEFRALFEGAGAQLPLPTRVVIGVSEVARDYGWAVIVVITALVLISRVALRDTERRLLWDSWKLRLPIAGDLLIKIQVASSMRLLATLLANDVALTAGLALVRDTARNKAVAKAFEQTLQRVKEGTRFPDALAAAEVFPTLVLDLVRIGDEASELESMLDRIAGIYDEEATRSLQRMVALLVPIVTIVLGVLIAGIIASILFAMLSINQLAL